MGNVTISVKDDVESYWRELARRKFQGEKGSMARVVEGLLMQEKEEDSHERLRRRAIETLEKGFDIGFDGKRTGYRTFSLKTSPISKPSAG